MVHEQRPIPILFSSDDAGVAPPLLVAIGSLLAHAGPGTVYHVYLLTNAVSEENLGRVRALFPEQGPHRFFPLEVSERLHRCVDALPSVGWPIAAWAKIGSRPINAFSGSLRLGDGKLFGNTQGAS